MPDTHPSSESLLGSPANPLPLTSAQFDRLVDDWRRIAGERGQVRFSSRAFWFFGSELATLRLLKKYRSSDEPVARQGYSENLLCHYFVLETPSLSGEERETGTNLGPS